MGQVVFQLLPERQKIVSVSGSVEALLGYSQRQFLSSAVTLQDRIHPGDAKIAARIFSPDIQTENEFFNLRWRHADGRIRCFRAQAARQKTKQRGVTLRLTLEDVKTIARDKSSVNSALNLRSVLESMDDCACLKDRNRVYLEANRRFRLAISSVDGEPKDVVGLTDYDLFNEEYADHTYASETKILEGAPSAHEIREATREGAVSWTDERRFPIRDDNGAVIGIFALSTDITGGLLRERELEESEANLNQAEKMAGLGSYVLDLSKGTWKCSEASYEVFGIDRDYPHNLEGWMSLVHPDDHAEMSAHLANDVLIQRKPFMQEYRIVRPRDRAVRWIFAIGQFQLDAKGAPRFLRGTIQDITERKLAEEELQHSAANLREAQQIARMGSFVLDLETQMWTASDVLHELLGLAKDREHNVSQWIDLIHADDIAGLSAEYAATVLDPGRTFEKDCRFIRQTDQAVCWAHVLARVELDAHRKPRRITGTIQDITERKQVEARLLESSGLLQIFIQDTPTGVAMFDCEMRYIAASRRWIEDHNLNEWEVIGRSHYDLTPEIPAHWREEHRRTLAGETVVPGEDSYEGKDGQIHWKRRMLRPWYTGSGTIGGIIVLAEDVTDRKLTETALRESKDVLQLFIEHAPASLAMFDSQMNYLAASRRWIDDHGLNGKIIVGQPHYVIDPDIPERWKEDHRRALAGETVQVNEDAWTRADGSTSWLRREIRPWMTGDGAVGGIMIFSENITQQKKAAERLHLAASVFTHASEGIMITDADACILDVNDAFTHITGYARDQVIGKNPRILNSGRQTREFYEDLWNQLLLKGHWTGEIWNRAKDGHIFAEMLTISAVNDSAGNTQQYVAMFSDITSIKEQKQQLEQVARHDLLTGLPNRVLLSDRLRLAMAQAHRHGKPVAIACLDLDNFRQLNDVHGHAIGDQLLTALAHRMTAALHEDDTLARLGGDEFVVVMPELDTLDDSISIVNALQHAISEPVHVGDLVFHLSASIGITFFPQADDVDADQLLRQADQSMYQAKLEGKSRFHVFDPRGDRDVRGHHEDIERIRNALKSEEFVLYFQPKVNMRTGEFLGAEALIRWQHPVSGLLPPAQFLPVIEGHDLSIGIGEWVIGNALKHMEKWQTEGFDVPVSVNVAPHQLQQPRFVERVKELLAAHPGIPRLRLELEVLESSALEDLSLVSKVIHDCRELGVSFAMDDFGTGYSSLSYLKRLPVDVLKIDQAFVHDMLDDPDDLMILEGILALAKSFHRDAIAEGVETVEHGVMLLRMGCQKAQGYGIARPMPGPELIKWAAKWRPYPEWVNVRPLEPGDLPLLAACAELRAWIVAIEAYTAGRRQSVTRLNHRESRFGAWLLSETLAGRAGRPGFKEIDALHQQVYSLAGELIHLKSTGREGAARAGLEELHALRDRLCHSLEILLQSLCQIA